MLDWLRSGVKPSEQRNPPLGAATSREMSRDLRAPMRMDARLSGMTNRCELPFKHRQRQQAKGADRLEPKGMWPDAPVYGGGTRTAEPPVDRQGLPRSCYLRGTW